MMYGYYIYVHHIMIITIYVHTVHIYIIRNKIINQLSRAPGDQEVPGILQLQVSWAYTNVQGDVNMHLEREVGDKLADLSVGFSWRFWCKTSHVFWLKCTFFGDCCCPFCAVSNEVKVEWQLTSPFDPTADVEGDQEGGEEYVCTQACHESLQKSWF